MVLVVDDDPTLAPLVTGLLSAGGEGHLDVESAPTLEACARILREREEAPCVILLDLRLPDSDGLATLSACRVLSANRSPIVVLTADGDRSLAVAALREGADDFLLKTELTAQTLARTLRYSIERTQYRTALQAAEARAGAVLRSIDSMIGIIGPDGRLIEVNEAWRVFARIAGCPVMSAEIGADIVAHCASLRTNPFVDATQRAVGRVLEGSLSRFEEVVPCLPPPGFAPGMEAFLRVRSCAIDLPVGRGVAVVLDDFTEKMRFAREIKEYAQRMAVAIEAGHVGTFTHDLAGGQTEWSPWHYRILGISEREYDGTLHGFLQFVHPDDRARVLEEMETGKRLREPIKTSYRVVRRDGSVRFVEGEARFSYDDAGQPLRLSGAIVDATDRQIGLARQALSQRLEALGELSAGVAHDLRNTLSLARSALTRLEDARIQDPVVASTVADLEIVTRQAGHLVGSLLEFGKPRSTAATPTIDLNATVLHFVGFLRRLLPGELRVRVECGSEAAPITSDPVEVQQVIMNLVLNARDALRGAGEVCVRVTPGAVSHRLEVADNGPGIPAADLEHLFEPYFRGRTEGQGSGLGLAIVKTILDSNGASVAIDSTVGLGTTLRISWPRASSELGSELAASPDRVPAGEAKQTVLLIQQAGYARRVLADGLADLGYAVHEESDLTRVMLDIANGIVSPAVIVVDEDGTQARDESTRDGLRRIRALGCEAQAVLVTDVTQTSDEEEFLVLPKPYSIGQICAAVRALLDEHDSDDRLPGVSTHAGGPGQCGAANSEGARRGS